MSMMADDALTTTDDSKEGNNLPIVKKTPRQGTPTESDISCMYRGGSIYIEFTDQAAASTKTISVCVYRDGELIVEQTPTPAPCAVSIGNAPGWYQIVISVEGGDTYMGILEID